MVEEGIGLSEILIKENTPHAGLDSLPAAQLCHGSAKGAAAEDSNNLGI
jgi:hypothetical protein